MSEKTDHRSCVRRTAIVISFIGGLVCVILPLGGDLFGAYEPRLELASGMRVQFLLASCAVFGAAAALRHRWRLALASVAFGWHAALVLPWYFGRPVPSYPAEEFKVLSFNVLHQNRRFDDAVALVRREQPLVAFFQEVTPPWPEKLAALRTDFPHHFRADELQMEIFSRVPIEIPEITKVGKMRGLVRVRFRQNGSEVVMLATHPYPQLALGDEGFRWRNELLFDVLPREIKRSGEVPLLVLGDLNATMWSPGYRSLVRQTGLHNARQGFGLHPTLGNEQRWHWLLSVPYDHCLVNSKLIVTDFRSGPFIGSDHLPIIATLAIQR